MGIENINTLKGLIPRANRVMDKKSDKKNKKNLKKSIPNTKTKDSVGITDSESNVIDIII